MCDSLRTLVVANVVQYIFAQSAKVLRCKRGHFFFTFQASGTFWFDSVIVWSTQSLTRRALNMFRFTVQASFNFHVIGSWLTLWKYIFRLFIGPILCHAITPRNPQKYSILEHEWAHGSLPKITIYVMLRAVRSSRNFGVGAKYATLR